MMCAASGRREGIVGRTLHDFGGRHVLVCGGTAGLGLAAAHAFADAGAEVTVTGRHTHTALYDADLSRFALQPLDLADRDAVAEVAAGVRRPDVLVVAEPPRVPAGLDPHEREFLAQAAQLGLVGPLHLATRLRFRLGQSAQPGGGAVVLLPATRAWLELGPPGTARTELAEAVQRLATSWAALGVRLNAVAARAGVPGQARLRVQIDRQSGPLMTRARPLRTATEQEVADLVLVLAGAAGSALTGQVLTVDAPPG